MAFIVKRTFVRPNTSTAWPWENFPVDKAAELEAKRSNFNVVKTESFSEDGLTATYTDSCPTYAEYCNYFEEAKPLWDEGGISSNAEANNVSVSHEVIENT